MTWILMLWTAFGAVTVTDLMTFEECKARAKIHVEPRSNNTIEPKAFCIKRDATSVVQIEPDRRK